MKEVEGNIWDYLDKGKWIVVTTNGTVTTKGEAVMGKGIALQAKQRFPDVPKLLGDKIKAWGNRLHYDVPRGLLFFPTKHNWWEESNLELIEENTKRLVDLFDSYVLGYPPSVYMVRLGCGAGGLDWKDVKPILEKYLDDRFIVIERNRR